MENFNLTIHGITNMPNLAASEKLVMIHLYTLKSIGVLESHVVTSSTMLNYTRHGYLKIIKRLIDMGYVKNAKTRGYYSLNETNIF
jgi:DNA-binding MarR family transcriptional regulator